MEDEYELLERMGEGRQLPPPPAEEPAANGHGVEGEPPKSSSGRGDRERGDRDRGHSRDRDRDRGRDKDRDRDRGRSKDRGGERGDKERSSRHRSSHRSRSRSPARPSSRHRDDKDRRPDDRRDDRRHRSRGRDDGPMQRSRREATPPEERLAREKERELKELERASRTIFAFNLSLRADERDIFTFFSKAGQVTDIRIITDRHTKRSKGLAYVEFAAQEQVFSALALTGQLLMGQAVMVKPAEAEKNLAWEAQQQAKQNAAEASALLGTALGLPPGAAMPGLLPGAAAVTVPAAAGPCTLQVSGYPDGLGAGELRQIFEPFGPVEGVEIVKDAATGMPNGTALIVFANYTDATNAKAHWNGKPLLDSILSVVTAPSMHRRAPAVEVPTDPSAAAAAVAAAAGTNQNSGVGELDEDDAGGGFKLTSQARVALMSRLAGSAGLAPPVAPALPMQPVAPAPAAVPDAAVQGPLGPASPVPTECLMLLNMFDPAEASEPGFVDDVKEDVASECSKFGTVVHVHVDATPGSRDSLACGKMATALCLLPSFPPQALSASAFYFPSLRLHSVFVLLVPFGADPAKFAHVPPSLPCKPHRALSSSSLPLWRPPKQRTAHSTAASIPASRLLRSSSSHRPTQTPLECEHAGQGRWNQADGEDRVWQEDQARGLHMLLLALTHLTYLQGKEQHDQRRQAEASGATGT